jgi:hypothetical protein
VGSEKVQKMTDVIKEWFKTKLQIDTAIFWEILHSGKILAKDAS